VTELPEWLFPATDAGVAAQAITVAAAWLVAIVATWHRPREIRLFAFGLGFLILALFAARAFLH
jgi:hypothetical protein